MPDWTRLVVLRLRSEFALPAEWAGREVIPLGELRPLLQAVSPVRDLSDIWQWVAVPMPVLELHAALATVARVEELPSTADPGLVEERLALRVGKQPLRAVLFLTAPDGAVERIELTEQDQDWFGRPAPEATAAMQAVAAALCRACGCVAVGL